ncbi:prolyl 4-hydroxylase subunit alpha [Sphingomonas sp. HMWF008]|nr:prolyl 4-hydroxylase subunit alpha [Sphingomonas sp. HMWF008]
MTAAIESSSNPLHRIPPFAVRDLLLSDQDLADLLAFAVAHEADFKPTGIGSHADGSGGLNPSYRSSRGLPSRIFKPWRDRIKASVAPLLPGILTDLGMRAFDVARYEIELVRHNDGDFYKRHIDTQTGPTETARRAISLVYYFHAEPKAFEGGALRLYALNRNDVFLDVEPRQNRLVAFASWVPHEVMPISCPSGRFIDSRFAINCWVRMTPPTPLKAQS